jgi:branched-chain amino acid transport system permease protein
MMLIMVIVGGTGTIGGPILGSFIYVFLLELLPTSKEIDLIIFGVIVILCVIFMPKGIYPKIQLLLNKLINVKARKKEQPNESNINFGNQL